MPARSARRLSGPRLSRHTAPASHPQPPPACTEGRTGAAPRGKYGVGPPAVHMVPYGWGGSVALGRTGWRRACRRRNRLRPESVAAPPRGPQHLRAGEDHLLGCHRRGRRNRCTERLVLDDRVAGGVLDVLVDAETEVVVLLLRRRIDPAALVTGKRSLLVIAGDDVLPQLWANRFRRRRRARPTTGKLRNNACSRWTTSCAATAATAEAAATGRAHRDRFMST